MSRLRGQRGLTLLEVIVGLAILGAVGVAFMSGLTGAFRAEDITQEHVKAENLARAQLEYIRYCAYYIPPSVPYTLPSGSPPCTPPVSSPYTVPPPGASIPSGYSITVTVGQYCDATPTCYDISQIQKNTVRVLRDGKGLTTVEDLKTNQ